MPAEDVILEVRSLRTQFAMRHGVLKAVDDLSFSLRRGRTLCIVGESGSGKTVTALSIMRLIDPPGRIVEGRALFKGRDLLSLSEDEIQRIRGDQMAMIFQDPMTSLNPSFPIGQQIAEGMIVHLGLDEKKAKEQAIELMGQVGIADPQERYGDYPHQFSGGMRQRVLIAGAIACDPELLIADEPTTALDVTIQMQILKLLRRIQRRLGSALILVTHDLGVVAAMADEVMVMYAGRMVEYGPVGSLFEAPQHPYTQGLLRSVVRLEDHHDRELAPIPGLPPDLAALPPGCSFRPRCELAMAHCADRYPDFRLGPSGNPVACHLVQGPPQTPDAS
jgi:oligopeptide/dipeptide ABC transporter ATP-binding protein